MTANANERCGLGISFAAKQKIAHQRDLIGRRIQSLRAKQQFVGPFRSAGIERAIASLRSELRTLEGKSK